MSDHCFLPCPLKEELICDISNHNINKFCICPLIDSDPFDIFCSKNDYKDPRNRPDAPVLTCSFNPLQVEA